MYTVRRRSIFFWMRFACFYVRVRVSRVFGFFMVVFVLGLGCYGVGRVIVVFFRRFFGEGVSRVRGRLVFFVG